MKSSPDDFSTRKLVASRGKRLVLDAAISDLNDPAEASRVAAVKLLASVKIPATRRALVTRKLFDSDRAFQGEAYRHAVVKALKRITGERWVNCGLCAAPAGPETGYRCFDTDECNGVCCPYCGSQNTFNGWCGHLVGASSDEPAEEILGLKVKCPRLPKDLDEVLAPFQEEGLWEIAGRSFEGIDVLAPNYDLSILASEYRALADAKPGTVLSTSLVRGLFEVSGVPRSVLTADLGNFEGPWIDVTPTLGMVGYAPFYFSDSENARAILVRRFNRTLCRIAHAFRALAKSARAQIRAKAPKGSTQT